MYLSTLGWSAVLLALLLLLLVVGCVATSLACKEPRKLMSIPSSDNDFSASKSMSPAVEFSDIEATATSSDDDEDSDVIGTTVTSEEQGLTSSITTTSVSSSTRSSLTSKMSMMWSTKVFV